MEIGLGVLNIGPDQFRRMTMAEFHAAVAGYMEKNGAARSDATTSGRQRPTRDRLDELMCRFPDHP